MTADDLSALRDRAKAYVREHLVELTVDVLNWDETGVIGNGRFRDFAALVKPIGGEQHLKMAESMVERAALEWVRSAHTLAATSAPVDAVTAGVATTARPALTGLIQRAGAVAEQLQRVSDVGEGIKAASETAGAARSGNARRESEQRAVEVIRDLTAALAAVPVGHPAGWQLKKGDDWVPLLRGWVDAKAQESNGGVVRPVFAAAHLSGELVGYAAHDGEQMVDADAGRNQVYIAASEYDAAAKAAANRPGHTVRALFVSGPITGPISGSAA
ncbi:hypothetical protein ACSFA0_22665 [Variovorax sp. LT1P1]|uniref:hypothetical protein n=1 Tax=Variovorax sp. LT1P1 TaxID=3443730 RepID=UPI003F474975